MERFCWTMQASLQASFGNMRTYEHFKINLMEIWTQEQAYQCWKQWKLQNTWAWAPNKNNTQN